MHYSQRVPPLCSVMNPTHTHKARVKEHEATTKGSNLYARWRSQSASVRGSLGVGPNFHPWTSRPTTQLHGVPQACDRLKEMIDICYIDAMQQNARLAKEEQRPEHEIVKGLVLDLSQAVQRKPWGYGVRTLHKNSVLYACEVDAVLPPQMLFRMHGFPDSTVMQGSPAQLSALVGESWSLPCAGSAIYAAYLTCKAPWWSGNSSGIHVT